MKGSEEPTIFLKMKKIMQPDVQSKQVKEELTNTYINVSFLFLLWRSHMICHEREPVLYV